MSNNGAARPPTTLDDDAAADAQAAIDNDEDPTLDYTVAVTPRQLAGGFAILAALLILVAGRRRGRRKG